jgi:hypothetical protein
MYLSHEDATYLNYYYQIIAATVLIAIGYGMVKLHSEDTLIRLTLGSIGGFTFIVYAQIMDLFASVQVNSNKFPKAHRSILTPQFIRSCCQIRWKLGGSYYVKRNTWPSVIKNVITRVFFYWIIGSLRAQSPWNLFKISILSIYLLHWSLIWVYNWVAQTYLQLRFELIELDYIKLFPISTLHLTLTISTYPHLSSPAPTIQVL